MSKCTNLQSFFNDLGNFYNISDVVMLSNISGDQVMRDLRDGNLISYEINAETAVLEEDLENYINANKSLDES